jgi:hypothetical protein
VIAYTVDGLLLAALVWVALQLFRLRERVAHLEAVLEERFVRRRGG